MDAWLPWVVRIGWTGVAVLVVSWLVVSFSAPGPRRAVFEWLGAFCLYVALLALFLNLLARSLANDSMLGMIGFGFLATMFSIGLVLALFQLMGSLRGPAKTVSSATN